MGNPADKELDALSALLAKIREGFYPEGLSAVSNDDLAHAILAAGFCRPDMTDDMAEEAWTRFELRHGHEADAQFGFLGGYGLGIVAGWHMAVNQDSIYPSRYADG